MGFLDALKRSNTQMTVTVEPAEALPGQEVLVRVTIEGEIDDKTQAAGVGLRCMNLYLVRERDDDDGDVDERWRAQKLHEERQELPLTQGTHEFKFVVPPGAPPSCKGAVKWSALGGARSPPRPRRFGHCRRQRRSEPPGSAHRTAALRRRRRRLDLQRAADERCRRV